MRAEVKKLVLSLCQSVSYMCTSSIQHWYCPPFLIWYDRYGGDRAYMDSKHLFVFTSLIPGTLYCKQPGNECLLEEHLSVCTWEHLKSIHLTGAEIPLQDADSQNGGVADCSMWLTQCLPLKFTDHFERSNADSYHWSDIVFDLKTTRMGLRRSITTQCCLSAGKQNWP